MGNIVRLDITTEDPNAYLKTIPDAVGEPVTAVIFAAKLPSGEWATGYCADCCTMQEGIGHLQVDNIDRMIRANGERYGLHTHK